MRKFGTSARRFVLGVAGAVLLPACGGGNPWDPRFPFNRSDSNTGSPSGTGTIALFQDDFSGSFPGTARTTPSTQGKGAFAEVSAEAGAPPPSLLLSTIHGQSLVRTECQTVIQASSFTASVDLSVPDFGEGAGSIALLDDTDTPLAAAEWHPSKTNGAVTFMIVDPASTTTTPVVSVLAPAPGPRAHRFAFSVSASGIATWTMDGVAAMSTSGFPTGSVRVRLYDNVRAKSGPFAAFYFDNVAITAP